MTVSWTALGTAFPIGICGLVAAVASGVVATLIVEAIPERLRRRARVIALVGVAVIALAASVIGAALTAPQTHKTAPKSRTPTRTSSAPTPTPTSPSPSPFIPSPSEPPDATLLYSKEPISLPAGFCGGSTVVTFNDGGKPTVSTDVGTLLGDSTKWDLELTNCPGTTQYLKPSHAQLSAQVTGVTTAAECLTAVDQNPAAANPQPADGASYCLVASSGLVALVSVVHVSQKPYDAHLFVTAWLTGQ